jgi:putative tryptophan/tyrosine transport system substrate-binding protein
MGSDMQRREFITLVGGAVVAWPLTVRAQQPAMPVIGFVNSGWSGKTYPPLSAFLKGLGEVGFVEGRNVTIEYRWAEGHYERLPALIANLVQRNVNVIAATSTPAAVAAKAANTAIPIVFTTGGDPVRMGLVSSLARPGANVTGVSTLNVEVAAKRLELMHELLPAAKNFALLVNSPDPVTETGLRVSNAAATALGLKLHVLPVSSQQDLTKAFDSLVELKAEALVIATATFFNAFEGELGKLSLSHRVPTIYEHPEFAAAGGLMSYSGDLAEAYRAVGVHVGHILKGEKPADLPVQQITKVKLIINLKTAKALGINVPNTLIGRADEVIE